MKIKAPDALLAAEVSRRGLMKTTAIGGLAMASSLECLYRELRQPLSAAHACGGWRN